MVEAAAQKSTRRQFIRHSGILTASALMGLVPPGVRQGAWAAGSDAPEKTELKVGFIPLTDCASVVIAATEGFDRKYGIKITPTKEASWAAVRDKLMNGEIDAAHVLYGLIYGVHLGVGGQKKDMAVLMTLNNNGQAITLSNQLREKGVSDGAKLKALVDSEKRDYTFAQTFPTGTHAMWLYYWLAANGINPFADVKTIVVPPPQMVANMRVGNMDGYCVGEPWNARAIFDGIGFTAASTQDIWKDHPEKVCAFTEEFALKNPKTVKAVLKALHEASVWLDDLSNRPEQCDLVSKATYINCKKEIILGRLLGKMDYGDGRKKDDELHMHFSRRNCNYPQAKYAKWFMSQYRRWGMVTGAPDYDGIAKRVMRADLYEEAMREIGYAHGGADSSPETFFDGATFDPANPEAFAAGFAVKSLKG